MDPLDHHNHPSAIDIHIAVLTSDGCHTAAGLIVMLLCLDLIVHAMLAQKQRCGVHSPCTSALQPLLRFTNSFHQHVLCRSAQPEKLLCTWNDDCVWRLIYKFENSV